MKRILLATICALTFSCSGGDDESSSTDDEFEFVCPAEDILICGTGGDSSTGGADMGSTGGSSGGDTSAPDCMLDDTRPGSTECGLNSSGTYAQWCDGFVWKDDVTACTDQDECENGASQVGNASCGLNNRGSLVQNCVSGAWIDNGSCIDYDECVDGDTDTGTTSCGNGGTLDLVCTGGAWVDDVRRCNEPWSCPETCAANANFRVDVVETGNICAPCPEGSEWSGETASWAVACSTGCQLTQPLYQGRCAGDAPMCAAFPDSDVGCEMTFRCSATNWCMSAMRSCD